VASLPSLKVPPAVPWIVGFGGIGLVIAALHGTSPIEQFKAIVTGQTTEPTQREGAAAPAADEATLVTLHNPAGYDGPGTFKLTVPAAAAFRGWRLGYGADIPVTSGYRSLQSQAASHAADPNRFADPDSSLHVQGIAVDVDNTWLNALPADAQSRLRKAATRTGWGQARFKGGEAGCGRPASGAAHDNDEPWHFSFGACG
jgi:hypothetical protein